MWWRETSGHAVYTNKPIVLCVCWGEIKLGELFPQYYGSFFGKVFSPAKISRYTVDLLTHVLLWADKGKGEEEEQLWGEKEPV